MSAKSKKVYMHNRTCEFCHKPFGTNLHYNVTCSMACRNLLNFENLKFKKFICIECQHEFETKLPNKFTCSSRCRKIYDTKKANAGWAEKIVTEPKPHVSSSVVAYSFFRKGRISCPEAFKAFRG